MIQLTKNRSRKMNKVTRKNAAGFSLLELMVVVAILGILATVAVPRFNIFRARGRQAEAKSNLGVIYTLQETHSIHHETFYDGAALGQADAMNTYATAIGFRGSTQNGGQSICPSNKLGFTLANCEQTRYGYYITGGTENSFTAIAHAPSDTNVLNKRVFPGCDGTKAGTVTVDPTGSPATVQCTSTVVANETYNTGDAWCMDEGRTLDNYRDIVEYCD